MKKTISVFASVLLLAALLQSWAMKESRPATDGKSELNVATFNLRMDTEKDGVNAWPNRKEMVKGLIRFHDFDIFGTQEGFKHMLDGVAELEGYAYIGAGRDDGEDAGEHSAIFYKTGRFDLLDKGNFWFSEAGMLLVVTVSAPGVSFVIRRAVKYSISSIPITTIRGRWHVGSPLNC